MLEAVHNIDSSKGACGSITLTKLDKEGNPVEERVIPMRSLVRNYWYFIYITLRRRAVFSGDQAYNMPTIDGGSTNFQQDMGCYMTSGSGADYRGIIVGSGTTAVAIDDSTLASMIDHGSTAGLLEYGSSSLTRTGDGRSFRLLRSFTNNSGGDVTVNEIGSTASNGGTGKGSCALQSRDVLDIGITLADQESLNVQIDIVLTEGTINIRPFTWMYDGNTVNMSLIDGGSNSGWNFKSAYRDGFLNGADGNSQLGLVAGTGTTPLSINDYHLDQPHSYGSGDGLINKNNHAMSFNLDTANNLCEIIFEADYTNEGSTTINITELGIIAGGNSGAYQHLVTRRVLDNSVDIISGVTRKARFIIRYTQ